MTAAEGAYASSGSRGGQSVKCARPLCGALVTSRRRGRGGPCRVTLPVLRTHRPVQSDAPNRAKNVLNPFSQQHTHTQFSLIHRFTWLCIEVLRLRFPFLGRCAVLR